MSITDQDRINEALRSLSHAENNINVVIEVLHYIGRPNLAHELNNVNDRLYRVINMLENREVELLPKNNTGRNDC